MIENDKDKIKYNSLNYSTFDEIKENNALNPNADPKENYNNNFTFEQNIDQEPEEFLVNKILNKYGYGIRMICLFISCFFGNYINYFSLYNVSVNLILVQSNFSRYSDSIEQILSGIAYTTKIIGCVTLGFLVKKFSRSTLFFISVSGISFMTLILVIVYNLYSYIAFLIISCYFAGLIESLAMDNLCETLPIRFRGYFLFLVQSGTYIYQLLAYYILTINVDPKTNIYNTSMIYLTHLIIILLMVIFIFFFYKDSPRFFMVREKYEEAFHILDYYTYTEEEKLNQMEKELIIKQNQMGLNNKLQLASFKDLISDYFLNTTIIMSSITILIFILDDGTTAIFSMYIEKLNDDKSPKAINWETFKLSIINLLGYLVCGLLLEIKILGRKINMIIYLVLSLIIYTLFTINNENFHIWLPLIIVSYSTINGIGAFFVSEIYPSKIRDASQGYFTSISFIAGMIGSITYMTAVKGNIVYPFYLSIFFSLITLILIFFVKHETSNRALDMISDVEPKPGDIY